ncbi:hypothetical protein TPS_07916 [Trichinella pseudospiralis]
MRFGLLFFVALCTLCNHFSNGQKPGLCPPLTSTPYYSSQYRISKCENDYSCSGNKKCCVTALGKACMKPDTAVAKSHIQCPPYLPTMFAFDETPCNSEMDCPPHKRCCIYGVVRRCLSAFTSHSYYPSTYGYDQTTVRYRP